MKTLLTGIVCASVVALVQHAAAQDAEPDEAIGYRQNVMEGIGGPAGNIGAILTGKVPHDDQLGHLLEQLAVAADPSYTVPAFRQNTAEQGFAETTALPKIWGNWDDFESRLRKLGEVTAAVAAAGEDVSMGQMKEVFDTCKGCHDEYRED